MLKLLKNIILVLITIIAIKYLGLILIAFTGFISFYKKRSDTGVKSMSKYFLDVAVVNDEALNVIAAPLFNIIMIKKGGYLFGDRRETISSAIGKNQKLKKLSIFGKIVNKMLHLLDNNHSIKSIVDF